MHDAEHLWLLDPTDGTASFAIGLLLRASRRTATTAIRPGVEVALLL